MRELNRVTYDKFTTAILEDLLRTAPPGVAPGRLQLHMSEETLGHYTEALAARMGATGAEYLAALDAQAVISYGPSRVFLNPRLRGKVVSLVSDSTGPVNMGRSGSVRD